MKIRAHHLLCIQGFQGLGYSKEFVENMNNVIEFLKSSPDQKIQITADCDVLCAYCPHNIQGKCVQSSDSNKNVMQMDFDVLKTIDLDLDTTIKAIDAFQHVKKNINSVNIYKICRSCKRKEKCLFFNWKINL